MIFYDNYKMNPKLFEEKIQSFTKKHISKSIPGRKPRDIILSLPPKSCNYCQEPLSLPITIYEYERIKKEWIIKRCGNCHKSISNISKKAK